MTRRIFIRGGPCFFVLASALALCLVFAAMAALYPQADGVALLTDNGTTVDASHTDQGYVMVKHEKTSKALKLRIIKGESTNTYDLASDEQYETFPLTFGSGEYTIQVFRQVSGKRYANDSTLNLTATIADEALPYLYPNQYVWYTADSAAVQKGEELCRGLTSDADKLKAIRKYVDATIVYDYRLASTVQGGYLPSVDDILAKGKGICFDYAALTACMLRTQGIPARLVIGWADTLYHAWNSVLIDGKWTLVDTTAEANHMKVKKYTEERIY